MSELAERLRHEFSEKEYRRAYVDEFLNSYLATQIQVLREQRGWSQERLAQEAGMKQSRISLLENVGYSSWSISTLKRLAEAFDLTIRVSFESFGKCLIDIDRFSRESLEQFSFNEDPTFQQGEGKHLLQSVAAKEGLNPIDQRRRGDGSFILATLLNKPKTQRDELQAPPAMPLQQALRQVATK